MNAIVIKNFKRSGDLFIFFFYEWNITTVDKTFFYAL